MSFLNGIFSSAKSEDIILVIDVGSGSIGAAFVKANESQPPSVIATARRIIPFQERLNVQRFILLMQETLSLVLDDLTQNRLNISPVSILITLASPWHTSQTRMVHLEQPEEFLVTDKGLKQILENEGKLFISSTATGDGPKELSDNTMIESHVMEMKFNGYEVTKPIGRKTKVLDLSLYVTMAPQKIVDAFKQVVEKRWPHGRIVFHSFMFSAFSAVLDTFANAPSFIILDIAGEVTDIALIRDSVMLESISFPLGHRSFVRSAMRELALPHEAAQSEIDLYLEGKLTKERTALVDTVFTKTIRDWELLLVGALQQLSSQYPIPRTIYLLTNEEYVSHFSTAILSLSNKVLGENQEEFDVQILSTELLSHLVASDNGICKDPFICVIIMMFEKLLSLERKRKK